MDATALRAMQAPIKEHYKSEPGAAMITLRAKGTLDDTNIACKVETGRALAVAGLHPATGGSGLELCSGDMLLEALVACAGVTLKAVSTALDIPLKSGHVSAEGDLDFRGTLGVAKDAPVGFAQIRLTFDVDTDAPQEKLDQLLKLTERYCVVYQTIKQGPPVEVRIRGRMRAFSLSPFTGRGWRANASRVRGIAAPSCPSPHPRPASGARECPAGARLTMSPELAFLLSLALRMAVAAAFVVIASMITERSGPAIGALIATLPVSGGPSYVFLALDHDDAFIAQSALASVPMNSASVLMSMAFILLVQRFGTAVSLAGGLAAWLRRGVPRERV